VTVEQQQAIRCPECGARLGMLAPDGTVLVAHQRRQTAVNPQAIRCGRSGCAGVWERPRSAA
jgi:hypothetical protein